MTAMIDVVFLLIIFFLCIDFRILESKLPAYLPKDVGQSSKHQDPEEHLRLAVLCTQVGEREARPLDRTRLPWEDALPHRLRNHRVTYRLGPERLDSLAAVQNRLRQLRPTSVRRDPFTGASVPVRLVIEPGPGVVYDDVARLADVVLAEDFRDLSFGGGLGTLASSNARPRQR